MERVGHDTLEDSLRGGSAPAAELTDQLFVALESSRPLAGSSRHSLRNVDEVCIGRGPSRSWQRVEAGGLRRLLLQVPDPRMSVTHARLRRIPPATWELVDCGSRNGSWLSGARVESALLADRTLFELGHTFFSVRSLLTPARTLGDLDGTQLQPIDPAFATLVPELSESYADLARIARSRVSVLLLGETGAGKEWLARAVHAVSGRSGEFVGVNCAALPASLLEAQLFGHVKGAFSGADKNQLGLVRAAHEGTLFLDEIADLPLPSQAALLRVLQEREVTPIGSTRAIPVDLRVVAATHAAIERRVEQGSFRADLFARLDGFRFTAPALRERREDFGLLVARVLSDPALRELGPLRLHPELSRLLLEYDWPRNIRELRQDLVAAAVLAGSEPIAPSHMRKSLVADREPAPLDSADPNTSRAVATLDPDDPFERELRTRLESTLEACDGNLSEVARRMGKARTQIQRWMKRFALDRRRYRAMR